MHHLFLCSVLNKMKGQKFVMHLHPHKIHIKLQTDIHLVHDIYFSLGFK